MSKTLSELLSGDMPARIGLLARHDAKETDTTLSSLVYDSRAAQPGSIYFALRGLHTDGHRYIDSAIENGARVVVHEEDPSTFDPRVHWLKVRDSRQAMSPLAAAFHDWPSRDLAVIGVTGTEGKSTTVYLVWQLLGLCGKRAGFFSTVNYCLDGKEQWNPEHQTTPEATTVQAHLAAMRDAGFEYAVVEASSHGLSPKTGRLEDVDFDIAVMTNVTHEHLEFHGSWEQYREDKSRLFRRLDTVDHQKNCSQKRIPSFSVANADDPSIAYFVAANERRTYTWSLKGEDADLSVKELAVSAKGSSYEIHDRASGTSLQISDLLPGSFNVNNVLAALLVVSNLLEIPVPELAHHVRHLRPVRGRMTSLTLGQDFELIIDYAHTPSSFEAVLPPLAARIHEKGGRLIALFGSAGERDRVKRALQGRVAAENADIVILCDEDPRGEEPLSILHEIASGCTNLLPQENILLIPDRREAIGKAVSLAQANDAVILLGKGHENSIIYANRVLPWDEIQAAREALTALGYGG